MKVFGVVLFILFLMGAKAQAASLEGYWRTLDGDAVIAFAPCEEGFCGRFVWLKDEDPAHPSLDDRNPDPDLKKRPLCGMTFLGGFEAQDDTHYTGGWLYSPRHGHKFSAEITLADPDTLDLRGYVFVPAMGGGQRWSRTEKPVFCGGIRPTT